MAEAMCCSCTVGIRSDLEHEHNACFRSQHWTSDLILAQCLWETPDFHASMTRRCLDLFHDLDQSLTLLKKKQLNGASETAPPAWILLFRAQHAVFDSSTERGNRTEVPGQNAGWSRFLSEVHVSHYVQALCKLAREKPGPYMSSLWERSGI